MSEIRATTISDAAGTGPITLTAQYAAKAWVNFDGLLAVIAARDSFNVSSLFDTSNGDYEVNLSSAMANANYAANATGGGTTGVGERTRLLTTTDMAAASLGLVATSSTAASMVNPPYVHLQLVGDLA